MMSAAAALSLCLASCYQDGSSPPNPPPFVPPEYEFAGQEWDRAGGADVYAAGSGGRIFRNGATMALGGVPFFMRADSVFVSEGDVYVAGEAQEPRPWPLLRENYAVIWKNGAVQRLGGDGYSTARSVFVSGGKVYVAGLEEYRAVLWVDGVPQRLGDRDPYYNVSEANSVFVSGGDVYVGGREYDDGYIWKNGVRQQRLLGGDGGRKLYIRSVFVSGGDVYAVGSDLWNEREYSNTVARALLFKNGVPQVLCIGANAWSVAVSEGGDVYVAGGEDYYIDGEHGEYIVVPVLWKNGMKQRLTDGSRQGFAYSVSVSGDDVYVAGYEKDLGGPNLPMLWINGEAVDLGPYGLKGALCSAFAVEKKK